MKDITGKKSGIFNKFRGENGIFNKFRGKNGMFDKFRGKKGRFGNKFKGIKGKFTQFGGFAEKFARIRQRMKLRKMRLSNKKQSMTGRLGMLVLF